MTNVLVLNDTSTTPTSINNNNNTASSSSSSIIIGNNNNKNTNNDNMEYDQIKFNFLKLLKQFKIFEFDKFMKWLEKLVYDYQRIGYNVIGK